MTASVVASVPAAPAADSTTSAWPPAAVAVSRTCTCSPTSRAATVADWYDALIVAAIVSTTTASAPSSSRRRMTRS